MAGVVGEGLLLEEEGDKGDVARVHSLDGESFGVDFDVDHLHKFLERVDNLPEESAFFQSCLKHLI